ncbi:hypothetical protein AYL99_09606 [Fonsecaea erecta]|uniref:Uncharacterized protein n=1 Tax=Fonsecaea erecta TaxID=1367422 RepID=A0A178Z9G8_9EURO|nr:hypothetical protein AYL99_09606 [Fonsecaea erecta]OAP56427.1 hypothetical protein AYL99_09606 [Fonsecaea erecta]
MDPSPTESETHHPKRLTDLPNEVLSHICSYIIADRPDLTPFQDAELDEPISTTRIEGLERYWYLRGYERQKTVIAGAHNNDPIEWCRTRTTPPFPLVFAAEKQAKNTLASFAATCTQLNNHVRTLCAQRTFTLTVSHCGLTFESFRSAWPQQMFEALRYDPPRQELNRWFLGRSHWDLVMVMPEGPKLVRIPEVGLPGNLAFFAFARAFKRLRHLSICVDLDIMSFPHKKLPFFLGRISQFDLSQADCELSLSTLSITVYLTLCGYGLCRESIGDGLQEILLGESVAAMIADQLDDFVKKIHQFQSKQNRNRKTSGASPAGMQSPLTVRLFIHGRGREGLVRDRARCCVPANWEAFCKRIQALIFDPKPTAENQIIDYERLICELGLP